MNAASASCHVGILNPVAFALLKSIIECFGRYAFCGYCSEGTGLTSTSESFKISLANSYHEQLLSFDK